MPKNKDLKRVVRARMQKTGERYTAARSQVANKRSQIAPDSELEHLAGMTSAAVSAKTGKTWKQWVRTLDSSGAMSKKHRDIARWLRDEHDVAAWWAQSVTVGYERIRGLRETGQRRGGGYDVNKSKTFPVSISKLYVAFGARARKQWMGDLAIRIKKSTPEKSMRLACEDGTPVEVYFWKKGADKSQVQLQHRDLANKTVADETRKQWTARLGSLGAWLASRE